MHYVESGDTPDIKLAISHTKLSFLFNIQNSRSGIQKSSLQAGWSGHNVGMSTEDIFQIMCNLNCTATYSRKKKTCQNN